MFVNISVKIANFIFSKNHKIKFNENSFFSATKEFEDCLIVATEGQYFLRPYAWAFQKNSPYLDSFNFYLQEFIEKGRELYLEWCLLAVVDNYLHI